MVDRMLGNLLSSGLSEETIASMGCRAVTREEIAAATGISPGHLDPEGGYSIPYPDVTKHDGAPYIRFRQFNGDRKYVGPVGHDNEIYIPPGFAKALARVGFRFFGLTEGEKKAAFLTQCGIPCLAIGGVTSWADAGYRAKEKAEGHRLSEDTPPHPTIRRYLDQCKCVIVIADSDYYVNPAVRSGMSSLRAACAKHQESLGITQYPHQPSLALLMVTPPALVEEQDPDDPDTKLLKLIKQGIDDYAVAKFKRECETRHDFDLAEFNVGLLSTVYSLGIAGSGVNDKQLALLTAHAAYEQICHTSGNYWHYDRQSGVWVRSIAKNEYGAPDAIHNTLVQASIAVNIHYANVYHRIKALKGKKSADLALMQSAAEKLIEDSTKALTAVESTSGMTRIITLLSRQVEIPRVRFDQNRDVVAVANGVLDLRTRRLTPHSPRNLITVTSPVQYNPRAKCPVFLDFLKSSIPSAAIRQYLQAVLGLSITGQVKIQCFFVHKGPGGSGKGTLFETLRFILGRAYRVGHKSLIIKAKGEVHPANVAAIAGGRCVMISELDESTVIDPASLKTLTGADTVPARGMGENFYEVAPTWKIHVATNDIPKVTDTSEAARRRFRIIPWDQKFGSSPDVELSEKLKAEASGVLNWLLDGVDFYLAGALHPTKTPQEIRRATNKMWRDVDTVDQWIRQECEVDKSITKSGKKELYANYKAWLEDNGFSVISSNTFTRKLESAGHPYYSSGSVDWVEGIRLRADAERRSEEFDDEADTLAFEPPLEPEAQPRPPVVEITNRPKTGGKIRRVQ